eukprot:Hpha_TRINITY_DN374_c0_g2::TRINITY_DN374_c0_g2_i1::g.112714::m.112714/K20781/SGT1; peptidyl serine alpha-galactosyltransferase
MLIAHLVLLACSSAEHAGLHVIFSTECTPYFDWQSVGMFWSVLKTYTSHGLAVPRVTRLSACDDPKKVLTKIHEPGSWEGYHPNFDTHVHPTYNKGRCPEKAPASECNNTDWYTAYNKPGSVAHWLEHGERVTENTDYIIFLDADQVVRRPIDPLALGARPGKPVSAFYGYLAGTKDTVHMGVKAEMVRQGRNKTGFEQVGGFFVHHIDDLRRVAPLWLRYTQRVRADPDSWANTGDVYNCPESRGKKGCQGKACGCGSPPWISEMYGYVFAASEVGLRHTVNNNVMLYPAYAADLPGLQEPFPAVMHYGLLYTIDLGPGRGYWATDKHWFINAHPLRCTGHRGGDAHGGFLEPPPESLVNSARSRSSLRTQSLALYTAWALFNATRAYLTGVCPRPLPADAAGKPFPEQRPWRCGTPAGALLRCDPCPEGDEDCGGGGGYGGDGDYKAVDGRQGGGDGCEDADPRGWCGDWASKGECEKNPGFMDQKCKRSCGLCKKLPVTQRRAVPVGARGGPSKGYEPRLSPLPPGMGGGVQQALIAYSGWTVALILFFIMRFPRRAGRDATPPPAAVQGTARRYVK